MPHPLEGHTVHRFDGDLNNLHLLILRMGGLVTEQTRKALQALKNKDTVSAKEIIEREHEVDGLEIKVDEDVITLLARRSPVARDLRVTIAFSKIITDLERIGDEAARIAHIAVNMYDNDRSDPSASLLRDIHGMGDLALDLLDKAMTALDTLALDVAEALIAKEGETDAEFQSSLRKLSTFILEDARNLGHTIQLTLILKSLERIGDHAINVAEYVIYIMRGEDVRHPHAVDVDSLDAGRAAEEG